MPALLYLLFFLSGATALVYEVAWARALGLVYGGSHLAVTTVLAVFMAGLALGSWRIGRAADRTTDPLRLYAALELGIAASAAAFLGLLRLYPSIYVPLAQAHDGDRVYLSVLRVALTATAMLGPTTLMGGTLPVLVRLLGQRGAPVGRDLSRLYGFNTLGAVVGTLASAFFLLRTLGAERTQAAAIATNLAIGIVALLVSRRRSAAPAPAVPAPPPRGGPAWAEPILWGIAISGFCALGYEVLWTRMLTMVVGTSVYGFAIMLAAFLAGIAAGSQTLGLIERLRPPRAGGEGRALLAFGAVQVAIGALALVASWSLRDLPTQAIRAQSLLRSAVGEFEARQGANFVLAFSAMFVPALLMGAAFPLAGRIHAARRGAVGMAVGEVAACNTIGAILGAAASGFVGIRLFGIERSLQLLSLLNAGAGAWIAATVARRRAPAWVVAATAAAALLALALAPEFGRMWDPKYFAVYRNNQRDAFRDPERIRDALANTDVLYYHEGVNETISVIRPKGAHQALLVNGRVEASSSRWDVQCQRTLGHLPMLLCPSPRRVFVLGLGTGMTLGATSIHPEVEALTLAEIEPGVLPAARAFAAFNHGVLDDPRLRIVFNDGRNFLLTTRERFDVITADPIHPWSGGAAYLYTREYYRLAAARLNPGGVACQWLPIYELTVRDLQTVVRTWMEAFRHGMLWLTYYDAELIGSNEPIQLDPGALERRIAHPAIRRDLAEVEMGSARDFLGYFVMGTEGLRAFGSGGTVNTDDNLWLEFSAPESVGRAELMGSNVLALSARRESLAAYLAAPMGDGVADAQRDVEAGKIHDRAHALLLWGRRESAEFTDLAARVEATWPDYAPGRFLRAEAEDAATREPALLDAIALEVAASGSGQRRLVEISAVGQRIGRERGVVTFVDNAAREVFGERYLDAPEPELEPRMREFAGRVLRELEAAHQVESAAVGGVPHDGPILARVRALVRSHTGG